MIRRMLIRAFVVLCLAAALSGCGPLKMPKLPKRVLSPLTEVRQVRLVDISDNAARYDIDVLLINRNDFPLPLTHSQYTLTIGGVKYATDTLPNATLPASRTVRITLPAVLATEDGVAPLREGRYETSGSVEMTPEGQVRQLLYEMGVPKPKANFSGQGQPKDALSKDDE